MHVPGKGKLKLELRGWKHMVFPAPSWGWLCAAPQVTPRSACTAQTDDRLSAPGIREAFVWAPPSLDTPPSIMAGMVMAPVLPPQHKDS